MCVTAAEAARDSMALATTGQSVSAMPCQALLLPTPPDQHI